MPLVTRLVSACPSWLVSIRTSVSVGSTQTSMTASFTASVIRRNAVVYVRQSTVGQVQENLESQRRQYDLVEVARGHGFRDVQIIDDDLGRSASGSAERPGFGSAC